MSTTLAAIANWRELTAKQIVEHLQRKQTNGNAVLYTGNDLANQFGEENVEALLKIVIAIVAEMAQIDAATKLENYRRQQIDQLQDRLQAYREALTVWDGNPDTEPSF